MSESMIERLEQTLFDLAMSDGDPLPAWLEWNTDDARAACRHIARAVLEELRKPTDEMVIGANHLTTDGDGRAAIFTAMIDAALALPLKEEG